VTRLTTCPDGGSVAERAAAHVMSELARAREERGVAQLALSGGTTPGQTYELIGAEPGALADCEVWFADERCVGPQDEESNYKLALETLLTPSRIAPERVHRMLGELGPERGAEAYGRELRERIPGAGNGVPVLDVVVLGIGPDAHIASLFPGAPSLDAGEEAVCLGVEDSPKPPPERITLSLAVLRAARGCLLIATGAGKADAVNAMLGEPSRHVPASLLRRERLTVITDDAAAPDGPLR
jgi:6-phosphogluconolactonase